MYNFSTQKKISIVITAYEAAHLLKYTIDTIVKQSMSVQDIELVVVSHKHDTTVDFTLMDYMTRLDIVHLSYDEEKWNEPAARNLGLKNADAYVCLLVNCGALLSTSCVEEHWNTHASNLRLMAAIGFTYGNCGRQQYIDGVMELVKNYGTDDLISYFFMHNIYQDVRDESYLRFNHKIHYLPAPWVFFSDSNISINKSSFADEPIYDERFTLGYGYEDLDLGFRLYQKGAKIFLNRSAEVVTYPQATKIRIDKKMSVDSRLFFNKHNHEVVKLYDTYGELDLNDHIINRSYDEVLEAI